MYAQVIWKGVEVLQKLCSLISSLGGMFSLKKYHLYSLHHINISHVTSV